MRRLFMVTIALAALPGCGGNEPPESQSENAPGTTQQLSAVTLQLNWFPEAEHGGYYAAIVHGYFKEAGLDVTINAGGPGTQVVQSVAAGRSQFGVTNADRILLGRSQGADTVAVMAPIQDSPRCIMVHEKSGIKDFKSLTNVTLAMSNTATFSLFLQKRLPLKDVRIVPYSGNVAQFLVNDDFAQQGYVFSEPFVAKKQGGDPHNLMVSDLGFNPYTSVLIAGDELVQQQPELLRKMALACARGWQTYLESPAETNEYLHGLNPEMGLDILEFGVEALRPLCATATTEPSSFGNMTAARWSNLNEQLVESGVIDAGSVDAATAFTNKFLETAP